jgi:hypothetical protein
VSDLTDAVDWALAENTRSGSPYFGRIDPAQIAYSGWSCGGVQALQVAKDRRVKTLVIHNSGILNSGPTKRGDPQSAKRFVGEDCGLCKDGQWSLERKQFSDVRGIK